MSIKILITDPANDKLITLEVEQNTLVIDIKALIEVEMQIPVDLQLLRYNNSNLTDSDPLSKYKIQDNDVLMVIRMLIIINYLIS